jgi:hypothetical protein
MRKLLTAVAVLAGLALIPVPAVVVESAGFPGAATSAEVNTAALAGAKDARAAAAREGGLVARPNSGTGIQASWFSGTLNPGATQAWYWNNANPLSAAFQVGFSPVGAYGGPCYFETVSSVYMQMPNNERKYFFTIKNIGTIACGATILLASSQGKYIGTTGGLYPGGGQTWSEAVFHSAGNHPVQLLGIVPRGATWDASCQIQVLETSYESITPGMWQYYFSFRNVGAITCAADIYLSSVQRDASWRINGNLAPGQTYYGTWYNANPLNKVYLPMADPGLLPVNTTCRLQVVRQYYSQVINASGWPERRFGIEVRNIGSHTCVDVFVSLAGILA